LRWKNRRWVLLMVILVSILLLKLLSSWRLLLIGVLEYAFAIRMVLDGLLQVLRLYCRVVHDHRIRIWHGKCISVCICFWLFSTDRTARVTSFWSSAVLHLLILHLDVRLLFIFLVSKLGVYFSSSTALRRTRFSNRVFNQLMVSVIDKLS
jgi:hypothetical protein